MELFSTMATIFIIAQSGILKMYVTCGTCTGSQSTGLKSTNLQYSFAFSTSGTFYLTQVEVCTSLSCYYHFGKSTIDTNPYVVLRKVDSSNAEIWTKFYSGSPAFYGFAINSSQSSIYVLLVTGSNLYVLKASTSDGSLSGSFVQTGNMYCGNYYCSITVSSDDSTLYIGGEDTTFQGTICKVLTSSTTTMSCYRIANTGYPEPFVFVQTNQIYFSTYAAASFTQLFMKVNLATPTISWQKAVVCGSGCTQGYSRSTVNYNQTFVFTLFTFNSTTYLTGFYSTNGALYGNKYVSSNIGYNSRIISLNVDNLYIGYQSSPNYYLVVLSLTDSISKTYQFASGITLYDMGFISTDNQLIFAGTSTGSSKMYILISPESILSTNSDVTDSASVLTTTSISISTSVIGSITGPTSYSNSGYTLSPLSFTIVGGTQTTSDVIYHLGDITISSINSNSHIETPETLTCSISGSTAITYSYSSDKGNSIPGWASVDSTNFKLIFDTPAITADTSYTFTLAVYTSVDPTLYYSTVYVNVKFVPAVCTVTSCNTCSVIDGTICTICNSGYQISSDSHSCNLIPSSSSTTSSPSSPTTSSISSSSAQNTTSKSKIGVITSLVGAGISSALVGALSIMNYSSPQGIWMVINHFQLLVLLLLTEAYFPADISNFFAGVKLFNFSLNFIPVVELNFFNNIYNLLNFEIAMTYLDTIGLYSGSVLLNNMNFFLFLFIVIFLHMLFALLEKCTRQCSKRAKCYRKLMKFGFKFFTLCVYIRMILEANQYLLICSIYEIHVFNITSLSRKISLFVAFLILSICIKLLCVSAWKAHKHDFTSKSLETKVFGELFSGIKNKSKASWLNCMLIMRRTLLVAFLICFNKIGIYIKIGYIVLIQIFCLGYLIGVRPLKELKFSIVNFIDEFEFLGLSSMLFFYNKKSDWTSSAESIFIYTIAGCNTLVSIIYFISFIIKLIQCRKAKVSEKHKKFVQPKINEAQDNNSNHSFTSQIIEESKFDRFRKRNRSLYLNNKNNQEEEIKETIYTRKDVSINEDVSDDFANSFMSRNKQKINKKGRKIYFREEEKK